MYGFLKFHDRHHTIQLWFTRHFNANKFIIIIHSILQMVSKKKHVLYTYMYTIEIAIVQNG